MCPEILASSFFSPDILDFIRLLHKYEVKYMVVGGEAVIFYGHIRLTSDIDYFYFQSEKNVRRLFSALEEFWQGNIPGVEDLFELTQKGLILQFGLPPNRIDLLNATDWPNLSILPALPVFQQFQG